MSESPAPGAQAGPPSLAKIFHVFFMIGLTSFGGGLVAYLKDEVVDKQRWLDDEDFLAALEIGQTLPGLNSTNVAVIVGRRLRGPRGAFMAALGLLLPGVVMLAVLGVLYIRFQHDPQVKAVLAGLSHTRGLAVHVGGGPAGHCFCADRRNPVQAQARRGAERV